MIMPILDAETRREVLQAAIAITTANPAQIEADVETAINQIEALTAAYIAAVDARVSDAHRALNTLLGERFGRWNWDFDDDVMEAQLKLLGTTDEQDSRYLDSVRGRLQLYRERRQSVVVKFGEAA